jgi:hypothetical protein
MSTPQNNIADGQSTVADLDEIMLTGVDCSKFIVVVVVVVIIIIILQSFNHFKINLITTNKNKKINNASISL